jgi:hypothetical protein
MAPTFDEPVVATRVEVPGPTRPEPAAQFGSHVGIEGNLDVTGMVLVKSGRVDAARVHAKSVDVPGPVRPEPAAQFGSHVGIEGNLDVLRDINVAGDISLKGGDCAEEFDVVETEIVESGTVMVLGEDGELRPSYKAYDKRVAGVISGAGDYKPGIVLDKQPSQRKRQPIALLGKAYCKVDAEYAPIEIGDLLTTSPTQGHAMKATDPLKAFGTVIGKALRPVREAQNLIPILIALQ